MVTPNSAVNVVMTDITIEERPDMDIGSDSGSNGESGEEAGKGGEGSTSQATPH